MSDCTFLISLSAWAACTRYTKYLHWLIELLQSFGGPDDANPGIMSDRGAVKNRKHTPSC